MSHSPPPDSGPGTPWYLRRPNPDDQTGFAGPGRTPPRPYPPPAAGRRSAGGEGPPKTPDIPWYLQRPDRPPTPAPIPNEPQRDSAAGRPAAEIADQPKIKPWLLVGIGALAVLIGASVLLGNISKLSAAGGTFLDVAKVQAGVLQTLADPAGGYGANTVTEVSCNNGRNPSAKRGTTFTCDATVNGAPRHVTVVVSDDNGTYEIDGPR
jgi:hypothetical protein